MAQSSQMLELGTVLPSFALPDTVSGRVVRSSELAGGKAAVVAFICNHCPYVLHIQPGLAELGRFCQANAIPFVAISSNSTVTHPQDGPEHMAREAARAGYVFPYLFDESQAVARAFRAACTPEFYVFDGQQKLAYRGQFDDSRPKSNAPVTGRDLYDALEALLAGRAPRSEQKASIGCGIKWNPGNEPDYAR